MKKDTTTRDERDTAYLKAFVHWSPDAQITLALDEFKELINVIGAWKREGFHGVPEKIIEEIADAEIMLEQLELLVRERGASDVRLQVDAIKAEKIRRLQAILAEGKR